MSANNAQTPAAVKALAEAGTSVWLDDLSRERITSGNLQEVIASKGVVGVTTNPAIFAAAMSKGDAYDAQLQLLAEQETSAADAVFVMAVDDVRDACDVFMPLYQATNGVDGRVSLEVDPRLAHDADATVSQAVVLAKQVDRENLMIKIPATEACLPAITEVLSRGISVNVTLIFSVARYRQVMDAFIAGIARAAEQGHDISKIHSVASFFISRVDTEIDNRLEAIGTAEAMAMRGKAAVANARLAFAAYEDALVNNPAWQELAAQGGRIQRPLWASTSVKSPAYPDTLYVTELAGPGTVNTMPESTLDATIAHGDAAGDTLTGTADASHEIFAQLSALGIDLADVWEVLEQEGVEKFEVSWVELLDTLDKRLQSFA